MPTPNARQSPGVVSHIPTRLGMVTRVVHPFATAGGGISFEYKVATLVAADLIRSQLTEHHGVVTALEMQTGPPGVDDLWVSLELPRGDHRTVHAQSGHRQPFTATNAKFAAPRAYAETAVDGDEPAFASGERRLTVIVDRSSPGHASMSPWSKTNRGVAMKDVDLSQAPGDRQSEKEILRTASSTSGRMLAPKSATNTTRRCSLVCS
jgi:hypothetical protein